MSSTAAAGVTTGIVFTNSGTRVMALCSRSGTSHAGELLPGGRAAEGQRGRVREQGEVETGGHRMGGQITAAAGQKCQKQGRIVFPAAPAFKSTLTGDFVKLRE